MKLLEIQSSPMQVSTSREISQALIERLRATGADGSDLELRTRDVSEAEALPHWAAAQVQAAFTPPEARTSEQITALSLSDRLCEELIWADTLVIAAPMWNFTIPSTLKAWIDHIVRVGVTFRYGPHGPQGLLPPGKKLYVIQSSGGSYEKAPLAEMNHVGPYLSQIFGFLGITDVTVIPVENTALDRAASARAALTEIQLMKL